jgi:hypothetical protein
MGLSHSLVAPHANSNLFKTQSPHIHNLRLLISQPNPLINPQPPISMICTRPSRFPLPKGLFAPTTYPSGDPRIIPDMWWLASMVCHLDTLTAVISIATICGLGCDLFAVSRNHIRRSLLMRRRMRRPLLQLMTPICEF